MLVIDRPCANALPVVIPVRTKTLTGGSASFSQRFRFFIESGLKISRRNVRRGNGVWSCPCFTTNVMCLKKHTDSEQSSH